MALGRSISSPGSSGFLSMCGTSTRSVMRRGESRLLDLLPRLGNGAVRNQALPVHLGVARPQRVANHARRGSRGSGCGGTSKTPDRAASGGSHRTALCGGYGRPSLIPRFAALAEFERNLIRERTVAGLKAARARGRKGGRPAKLAAKEIKTIRGLLTTSDMPVAEIAARFGVACSTLYRSILKPAV